MTDGPDAQILVAAGLGSGSREEQRIVHLLEDLGVERWPFDRAAKRRSGLRLLRRLVRSPPRLYVLEGTGLGIGLPAIVARLVRGTPYVVSSGDAIGPFWRLHGRGPGLVGGLYERVLCRMSSGFIGWTPYLAGRAMTFGAPRAVTAAGWSSAGFDQDARERIRDDLGIPAETVVFGIVGSLVWTSSTQYSYGLELVQALRLVERPDVRVLIVGDGDGRTRLEEAAAGDERVIFTGRVEQSAVPGMLSAIDVASLPQSRDGVGLFRYTTKLSEYTATGVGIVTGRLPFAYDLTLPGIVRLPGTAPWDPAYVRALAEHMRTARIPERNELAPDDPFDRATQRTRVTDFVADLLGELPR